MASEAWRDVAEHLRSAAERRDPEAKLARDEVLRLLGPLGGRDVLELGCARGELSLLLARRGARVVGIDASPAELQAAATAALECGVDPRPSFRVADPLDPESWPADRFDRVIALRAFELERLEREAWKAIGSRLRGGGLAVLGFAHPYRHERRVGAPLERLMEGARTAGLRLRDLREPALRAQEAGFLLLVALERGRGRRGGPGRAAGAARGGSDPGRS
jgi:SAM-dependent methyltransferase